MLCSPQALLSNMDATLLLCTNLLPKLMSDAQIYTDLLKVSISAVLLASAQYLNNKENADNSQVKNTFSGIEKCLQQWISNPRVIGGSVFGGCVPSKTPWKAREEQEVRACVLLECYLLCYTILLV